MVTVCSAGAVAADAGADLALGYLLADVVRLMRRDFRSRATGLGLTPALTRLLLHVHRVPGCRQADLAALLDLTPVTLGRMIDRLAVRGYVRRRPDPIDRRAVRVFVAARGKPLLARMTTIVGQTTARATGGLAAGEQAALQALLRRLIGNLGGGS